MGAEPSLPEKYFNSAWKKTAYPTWPNSMVWTN